MVFGVPSTILAGITLRIGLRESESHSVWVWLCLLLLERVE